MVSRLWELLCLHHLHSVTLASRCCLIHRMGDLHIKIMIPNVELFRHWLSRNEPTRNLWAFEALEASRGLPSPLIVNVLVRRVEILGWRRICRSFLFAPI